MASNLNSNDLKTKFVLLRHCFEIHIAIKSPIGPGVHCQILQTRSASASGGYGGALPILQTRSTDQGDGWGWGGVGLWMDFDHSFLPMDCGDSSFRIQLNFDYSTIVEHSPARSNASEKYRCRNTFHARSGVFDKNKKITKKPTHVSTC